jgi:hypothetical protein
MTITTVLSQSFANPESPLPDAAAASGGLRRRAAGPIRNGTCLGTIIVELRGLLSARDGVRLTGRGARRADVIVVS